MNHPDNSRRTLPRNIAFLAMFAICVVLLIVLRTQGFLTPPESPPADRQADEQAIRKVLADQETAWNKGDLEGFMVGYWRSENLTFYSGRDKQKGWQTTYDRYKQRYQGEGKEMGALSFSEIEVEMIAPQMATVRGRWKLKKKSEEFDGLYTLLLRKLPEGWRIVHDHTSVGESPTKKPTP
jgi:beta-aspartyl-peptidase (threonine type)